MGRGDGGRCSTARRGWSTTDEDTPLDAWRAAVELALDCGAQVVPTTASEHDAAVARISHLPHLLAAVLAATGADGGSLALSLAAGSFRDGTRVMGTRPELVLAMCEGNRGPLLDAVDEALGRLGAAGARWLRRRARGDGSCRARGAAGVGGPAQRGREEIPIDLTDPEAFEKLRDLGTAGGRVLGWTATRRSARCLPERPLVVSKGPFGASSATIE